MTKQVITTNELNTILANTPNSIGTFVKIVQLTTPKTTKKCRISKELNTTPNLRKLTILNAILNTEYVKGIENQLVRENKAKTDYKQGINTMPLELCENNNFFGYFKGNAVIQYRPFENSRPKTKFVNDSKIIDKENLQDILPKTYKATNQGSEKEILWRKLYTKNIRKIQINKTLFVVKN